MLADYEQYDILLAPTMADVPQPVGSLYPPRYRELVMGLTALPGIPKAALVLGTLDQMAEDALSKTPFTQLTNLTGQPSASVPLHWSAEGLPVGVMLAAAMGREEVLVSLSAQLERARPWFDRRAGRPA